MVTLSPELKALLTQAAEGDADAEYEVGMRYLEGDGCGITQNNRKAFRSFLSAACKGSSRAMGELSRSYTLGRGIRRDHRESYIWALLAKSRRKGLITAEYLQSLESQLSADTLERAQEEAEKRSDLLSGQALTPDYCLESSANAEPRGLRPEDRNVRAIYLPDIKPLTLPVVEADPDPVSSDGIAYKYVRQIRKNFDPALVEFELIVPARLKATEDMDFTQLKIRYSQTDTDKKDVERLTRFRFNKAQRRLLIMLALVNSLADPERAARSVRNILADSANRVHCSRLNHIFKLIFPDCASTQRLRMINRCAGKVNISLRIDSSKLLKARDYPAHLIQTL